MKVKAKIINSLKGEIKEKIVEEGYLLSDLLKEAKIFEFPCGGKGRCGKCKVRINEKIEYTAEEVDLLDKAEINDGIHLACKVKIYKDLSIFLNNNNEKFSVVTDINVDDIELNTGVQIIDVTSIIYEQGHTQKSKIDMLKEYVKHKDLSIDGLDNIEVIRKLNCINHLNEESLSLVTFKDKALNIIHGQVYSYGMAIDIGTTTMALYLYDLITGECIDKCSKLNPQRIYGYDVISRINHGQTEKGLIELRDLLVEGIFSLIKEVFGRNHLNIEYLYRIVIVGNTTMNHLLTGIDVASIGRAPFTPVFLNGIEVNGEELGLMGLKNCVVTIINSISSYVGGDIVAGIIDSGMVESDRLNMLVDIGTNGEIVLGNRNNIYCCATAAGPAFEAANISCGIGSVAGAISKVYDCDGKIRYNTINNEPIKGICGTGLIDLISYLLKKDIIDETGFMEESFQIKKNNNEYILLSPKDVREVQLAKAAIAAGIETLIGEVGVELKDIHRIYIAGGFGNHLQVESAVEIGLLPNVKEKIETIGNAAGSGACKILLNINFLNKTETIAKNANYIELSTNTIFMEKYIEKMYFGEI